MKRADKLEVGDTWSDGGGKFTVAGVKYRGNRVMVETEEGVRREFSANEILQVVARTVEG